MATDIVESVRAPEDDVSNHRPSACLLVLVVWLLWLALAGIPLLFAEAVKAEYPLASWILCVASLTLGLVIVVHEPMHWIVYFVCLSYPVPTRSRMAPAIRATRCVPRPFVRIQLTVVPVVVSICAMVITTLWLRDRYNADAFAWVGGVISGVAMFYGSCVKDWRNRDKARRDKGTGPLCDTGADYRPCPQTHDRWLDRHRA